MRMHLSIFSVVVAVFFVGSAMAVAANIPSCNSQMINRQGDRVSVSLSSLANNFNQRLQKSGSSFQDLQLTPEGNGKLKISGKKNGTPMSIQGPIHATNNGNLVLQANQITKGGMHVSGIMSLFGKDLADYVNLQKTKSMKVQKNKLYIYPDRLLDLSGNVKSVQLNGSQLVMQFASQPCQ